jgi:hypothetical protein
VKQGYYLLNPVRGRLICYFVFSVPVWLVCIPGRLSKSISRDGWTASFRNHVYEQTEWPVSSLQMLFIVMDR